jgi:hypothetical protein
MEHVVAKEDVVVIEPVVAKVVVEVVVVAAGEVMVTPRRQMLHYSPMTTSRGSMDRQWFYSCVMETVVVNHHHEGPSLVLVSPLTISTFLDETDSHQNHHYLTLLRSCRPMS